MAYTYDELIQAWTAVNAGVAPNAATAANLQVVAGLSNNGQLTDAQILSNIVNSADNGTALAILSYQFFTGKSPTKVGIDYLVNSTANPNDLNDAYYKKFNIENRYINFAANLGVTGEGAAIFAGKYGALSFADYVVSIYQTIIGGSYATAAGVNAANAIADIISRKDAILATAQSAGMIKPNATAAEIDLALKAATAGYLMGEAIKADVGIYAATANNFMVAIAQGSAIYNTDITRTYEPTVDSFSHGTGKAIDRGPTVITPPPPPITPTPTPPAPSPLSFTLAAGAETLVGAAADDTFTAPNGTFDATEDLNGGLGNDTLTINSTAGFTVPASTVTGIETVNIVAGGAVNTAAVVSGWTGVTKLNVTSTGAATVNAGVGSTTTVTANTLAAGNVAVNGGAGVTVNANNGTTGTIAVGGTTAPTGAIVVNVNSTSASTLGAVTVTGGTTVTVTATNSNANATTQTTGSVTVNGKATTTSVTVKAPTAVAQAAGVAGVTANPVAINDLIAGGSATKATITSVSVDGATTVSVVSNAMSTFSAANTSSNLIINNSSTLAPGDKTLTLALTLNGTTGGTLDDADVYTTVNATTGAQASKLANITFGGLTTLNLAGASQLTLNAASGMSALTTVVVTGAAGIVADLSGGTVTSVNTSATTGANTVTINGANATFTGGTGADTVSLTINTVTKAINGGTGGIDILKMGSTQAATASGSGTFATLVTNFERLQLTGATNQTIDLAVLGNYHHVSTSGGNGLTLNGLASTDTVVLTGAGTAYTLGSGNFGGASDSINLQLTDGSGAGVSFASTGITATGVETVNITVTDSQATPTGAFNDAVTWLGSAVKAVNVSGNAGLSLTAASTALTSVDASGITLGGFSFTSGALAAAAAIKGSATGTNTVTFTLATGGLVTYTGGSGADNVTGSNGLNNIVTLGNGANSYTATTGNHTVTGGTGVDAISVGGGASTIDVGSGADSVIFSAATASGTSFTSITGMSVGTADTITFTGQAPTAGALGAAVAAGGSLAASLDAAAASAAGAGTPVVKWFVFGGDTYVVLDHSDNTTFTAGVDYAVKLVGTLNLAASSVAGAVLTL